MAANNWVGLRSVHVYSEGDFVEFHNLKTLITLSFGALLLRPLAAHSEITVTNISAGAQHSLFLRSDGSLWTMGSSYDGQLGNGTFQYTNRPQRIVDGGVTALAGGGSHSLFLTSDGSLWA